MTKMLFTVEEYDGANNAGPKAKEDIEQILKNRKFKIVSQQINIHSKISKLSAYLFTIPRMFPKNQFVDELYFQYPTYSSFLMKKLIKKLKQHCAKLIFIIHDIESLRIFVNNKDYWYSEKQLLNQADGLIVHNDQMKKWLLDNGVNVPMISLEIFDYLSTFQPKLDFSFTKSVCFAGNLSKAKFLDKLALKNISLTVYGPNAADNYKNGVKYEGQYSPNDLPNYLTQDFGLVWDGTSIITCDGKFGNYMKYNNPHKVSLYLSCGIPVVIWKKAALANFIVNNNLGIAVESLGEMDEAIAKMEENDYKRYKRNALEISKKLRMGYYTQKAVNSIQEELH
ncbi:galactofuranosyltransferase [uncultured Limosilactobacillus sp.]|uniref:galactofuranosyltransferase n=1 Tax=uncultured Limosilactobacillus sp. TaxID=2837629 RepID=UPI0025F0AF04|nr:galactofuranosyltransferase [uncultured Limosilactobacillus sp.]